MTNSDGMAQSCLLNSDLYLLVVEGLHDSCVQLHYHVWAEILSTDKQFRFSLRSLLYANDTHYLHKATLLRL